MDAISPERFTTQMSTLGKSIGVFFDGKDLARVEGLTRVLRATQRASEANLPRRRGFTPFRF
jgi:hypothetical protein